MENKIEAARVRKEAENHKIKGDFLEWYEKGG